ncbi:diacylglycerol kinase family protein [Candidatus Gottesmanbacteria bacterium]|nr:diacylglycerol kinase family protein [Candidatus Gottesmanbacteria bacterium]
MKKILKQHHISFQNAFAGVWWALTTQPNFRIHIFLSLVALGLSWILEISPVEWSIIIFAIVLGLGSEMVNTALEAMTDLITSEWRKEAKIAKDVAAGMMLMVAFGALIVGLVILGPKLWILLGY